MDLCHFFFILYLSPAPGGEEIEEIQSYLFWVLQCLHFGFCSVFIFFFSSFLCLQLEESFRWERFPNLCCEAVNPPGKVQVSLGELSVDLQRHQSSSERHQLCPHPPCRPPSGNSKRKSGGEKKPKNTPQTPQEKTPGSDSAVGISSHPCSVVSPLSRVLFFVFL